MKIVQELLTGVFVLESNRFEDNRGYLSIPFESTNLERLTGHPFRIDQTMRSLSKEGVLRGLHYQDNTQPISKLISCTRGLVYDVVVDLRETSPTFGQWAGIYLYESRKLQVYAPAGMAHGFLSLSPLSEVFYYQDGIYNPEVSCILSWNDPDLAIKWPSLPDPILSDRDRSDGISWQEYKNNPMF